MVIRGTRQWGVRYLHTVMSKAMKDGEGTESWLTDEATHIGYH